MHNLSLYESDIFHKNKFEFLDITTHPLARLKQFGTNGEINCNTDQQIQASFVLASTFT